MSQDAHSKQFNRKVPTLRKNSFFYIQPDLKDEILHMFVRIAMNDKSQYVIRPGPIHLGGINMGIFQVKKEPDPTAKKKKGR